MLPFSDHLQRLSVGAGRLPVWYQKVIGPQSISRDERVDIPDIQESYRITFSEDAKVTPGLSQQAPGREAAASRAIALYLSVQQM